MKTNIYGWTVTWLFGNEESTSDGFGYEDDNGKIEWFDGYEPLEDEFHTSFISRCKEVDL